VLENGVTQERTHPVGSVENALRLLMMFQESEVVRVAEVGRQLGVARSTSHRLLQILQAQKFVEQDPETRGYRVGSELVALAISLTRGLDLRTVARPIMTELVERLGETVLLSVLRGPDIFFIDSIETTRALRIGSRTGMTRPAHATAAGRVMLAALDRDDLLGLYPDGDLASLTPGTVATRDELEQILEEVRRVGYATSISESESDMAAVATAVRDSGGRVVSALAIAAPPSRLDDDTLPAIIEAVKLAADRITSLLSN
jgi:DNA-binding IclR family transcriptional regulator